MTSGSLNKAVHVHAYVRPRYFRLLAILIAIIVVAHFLFAPFGPAISETPYLRKVDFAKSLRSRGSGAQPPIGSDAWKKVGDWCTEEEYLDGEWVKREEEVTMDNIRKIFHYTVSLSPYTCRAPFLIPLVSRTAACSDAKPGKQGTAMTRKTTIRECPSGSWRRRSLSTVRRVDVVVTSGIGGISPSFA